ncbi:MAG: TonB-dependent receptor [Kordiimonadaceae bacterium]|jgi:iron complex outermembrane recepter protein|nr:TonB-dependent receptor [Kordiimonadaceae bacterium]MBT6037131.1 TonB-dependent receptor [Kordiimonadaceae bacterium]MBT6330211.1 TonB-dependent receptor [Kordiimonadaceae bacterium]
MKLKNLALLGTSIFSLVPAFAMAQDIAEEEIITVTGTRSVRLATDVVGNQASVSGSEIEFLSPTHINEALQGIAGANISRNNGQESLISLRSPIFTGAGACGAFLTAQDGVPLRAAGFCNVNELFESFSEQAGRIEIVRGPGSVLYGSNAMHGIINIVSKGVGDASSSASMEAGSWGYLKFNASGAFKDGNNGFRVTGSVMHDGGYIEESGFNQQKGMLRHEYDDGNWEITTNFMVTNLDQETAGYLVGLDSYKDPALAKTNANPEAYRKAKSFRYWSTISKDITDNVRWQFSPYVRSLDMEFLMHFLPGAPLEENEQKSAGFQNGFYINEGSNFEIIAGFDGEMAKGELKQTQANAITGSAFLAGTIPAGKQYDYEVNTKLIAGFVRADFDVNDQLSVIGGVRAEHMKYDYNNRMNSGRVDENGDTCGFGGCRYTRPGDREDSFNNVSFEAGLLYKIDDNNSFFSRFSRGFRAPQAAELYRLQTSQLVADIDSVKLDSYEAGLRGKIDAFTYEVSAFYMKKDNVIFQDNRVNVDNGKSKHTGVEAMFEYQFPIDVSIRASGSIAKHEYDFDQFTGDINWNGLDIDTAPNDFGSIQLNWAPADKVKAGLEWIWMGSYAMEPTNAFIYEGHNYFNLRVEAEAMENVDVFLRVMNITNVRYAERADHAAFGVGERYFVGRPRGFYGGARVRF